MLKKLMNSVTKAADAATEVVPAARTVDRLKLKLVEAERDFATANSAFADAVLSVELGEKVDAAGAQKVRDSAKARVADLRAAIKAAESRDAKKAADDVAKDLDRRWRIVDGHLADRERAAVEVDGALELLARAFSRLADLSDKAWSASPTRLDLSSEFFGRDALTSIFILAGRKAGLTVFGKSFAPEAEKSIAEFIASANASVRRRRNSVAT